LNTTTVPAGPVTSTSSGWRAAGSASARRGTVPNRCEPGTTRVAPLLVVKSSSSQIELQTW